MEGYRLSETHLRLGSKIHISDFVFVKKFFQNGFFASKYGFLASQYIRREIEKKGLKNIKIVLIGYGYYSELLVSHVQKYLKLGETFISVEALVIDNEVNIEYEKFFEKQFDVDLYFDDKGFSAETIVVILLPISSTLSTPAKLENEFNKQLRSHLMSKNKTKYQEIVDKYRFDLVSSQAMVVVGASKEELKNRNSVVWKYWRNINEKSRLIEVVNISIDKSRFVKYYTYIDSHWYDPHHCPMCDPDILTNEKPIYYADKAFVEPIIKNRLPKWRKNEWAKNHDFRVLNGVYIPGDYNPVVTGEMVGYVHYGAQGKHYYYYILKDLFYRINEDRIRKWAINLRRNCDFGNNVLLISTEKAVGGGFINLVNECLFSNSASIIKINPFVDDVEEIRFFFSDYILRADKIYFLDNLMGTGKTLLAVSDIVKYVSNGSRHLEAAIVLIERLDYYDYNNVSKVMGGVGNKLFSFFSLCFPVIYANKDSDCYLCQRYKKYEWLSQMASLNSMGSYIKDNNLGKLKKIEYYNGDNFANGVKIYADYNNRRLLRLMVSHYLYLFFSEYEKNSKEYIDIFFRDKKVDSMFECFQIELFAKYLMRKFLSKYISENSKKSKDLFDNEEVLNLFDLIELKITIIKVLSEPPFVYYKILKDTVFGQIIRELDFELKSLIGTIDGCDRDSISVSLIDYIRVLIKQAAVLNSNYVINCSFLQNMMLLIDSIENYAFIESRSARASRSASLTFFCVSAIKECMLDNEPKAIMLERNIDTINNQYPLRIERYYPRSKQFLDMLKLENTGIIMQALSVTTEIISSLGLLDRLSDGPNYNLYDFRKLLYQQLVGKYRIDNKISNMIMFEHSDEGISQQFVSLSLSYSYLTYKFKDISTNYEHRLKILLEMLSDIIGVDYREGGAFILYAHPDSQEPLIKSNMPICIAEVGCKNGLTIIKNITKSKESVAKMMLDGMNFDNIDKSAKHYWTVRSLNSSLGVLQSYCVGDDVEITNCEELLQKEYKRFYYYRICSDDGVSGRAVMIFFDKSDKDFDLRYSRYMLAIRYCLVKYFDELENDAFKADVLRKKQNELYQLAFTKFNHDADKSLKNIIQNIDDVYEECSRSCGLQNVMFDAIKNIYILSSNVLISKIFNRYVRDPFGRVSEVSDVQKLYDLKNDVVNDKFIEILKSMLLLSRINISFCLSENVIVNCYPPYLRCFIVELVQNAKNAYAKNIKVYTKENSLIIYNDTFSNTSVECVREKYDKYLILSEVKENLTHAGLISIKLYCEQQYGIGFILPKKISVTGEFQVEFKFS